MLATILRFAFMTIVATMIAASPADAQYTVPETPSDNDMDPSHTSDGWVNTVGTFDSISIAGHVGHPYVAPPDGNNYCGGVQYSGDPGIQETIQKPYTNLVAGETYAVEWYVMTDEVVPGGTTAAEAWYDVTLCSDQQETLRLTPAQRRVWFQERLLFTADATTCSLSFRARNTTGDNASWIFLDGVAIGDALSSDLEIAKSGPLTVSPNGDTDTYQITVTNNGPDATGGTVDVTDYLPVGVTVNSGAAAPVTLGGADAADWTCASDAGVPQQISCTSTGPLANGASSVFTFTATFAPGTVGDELINTASIVPTVGSGTQDPTGANDASSATTTRAQAEAIPTVGNLGIVVLMLLMAGLGVIALRIRM